MATKNVTIFKNIKETSTPFHREVGVVLERIKEGSSKELVKNIRQEKDKSSRNELKKMLPAICFSGVFSKRNDNSINEHSGIICLDFDGYPNKKELLADKERLTKDKFVYSVFISPSGNGLKALVKIPQDIDNHVNYFNSLDNHFNSEYFDKTCKNISRVCYESYDPLIYINENSSIWDTIEDIEYREVSVYRDAPTIPITDENKIVDILVTWWTKKYPMSEGQRNQNTFILAMAFNDYGINKSLASYVLNNYATRDFPVSEITRTIDSAYANTQNFGTKYYEDDERVNNIKAKLRRGVTKKEIRHQLAESNLDGDTIEAVLTKVSEENSLKQFWTKNDKGAIKIVHILFKHFLEDNGFYKYCPEGSKNYVFVKVTNNLIDHTSEKEIKDFILGHLIELDDSTIYNYFADNTRLFREEFLTLLATIDIYFIEDTKDSAYLYYRNCAVHITKDTIKTIDYLDLGGYVWKDHVIDRNFDICDVVDCDYKTFINNICGGEDKRVKSMESTIGFMLHAHKNLSYCPAIILNDEVISDNPEGGTGKGLFMNALSKMKKVVTIDGKSFTFERSFAYQLVSADTQILVFDDVKKNFDFERLFSVVTEGLTLEKKNKDAIKIPFSKSPKIAITTNYAIKGAGNSFARRKWELELHQHYNKNFTPLDEFGKLMFGDWSDRDWCSFDNYMIGCLQKYLAEGLKQSQFVNLKIRQLSAETCHDFIEWCGLIDGSSSNEKLISNSRLNSQQLYYDFIEEYPDYGPKAKMTISRTRFYKWLNSYALYKTGVQPEVGRDINGKYITIKTQ
ncbi:MAG: putative virulence protein [Prokaryotic dsDNA virus sp.]|nr:MAG: putative virulence protein [Prokaryotic dsDNA virus sp.]|tara:strand:- start:3687 stop:6074 length:2388 start_codon:yes stop_codon:yes gene_type:complete